MTGSIKMVKLDIFTMRSQLLNYLALVVIVLIFGYIGSSMTILGINVAWYVALMSSNIFAIQEKNNLDRLYGSVSISFNNIVLGRYIFLILSYLTSFLAAVTAFSVITLFQSKTLNMTDVLLGFSVSFLVFSLIAGIETPLFFKMGYTKARAWFMLSFVLVLGLALIPSYVPAISEALKPLLSNHIAMIFVGIIISCVVLYISFRLSIIAYRKRI